MAGSAGAIRAGKAFVELFTDKTKFDKGLAAASAKLKAWGATVSSMGTKLFAGGLGLTAGLLGGGKVFADIGSELLDASDRTGIAVEQLSALKFAAEQSGASFEDLENGIGKMQKALVAGADGSKEMQKAMMELGLAGKDLTGLSGDEQIKVFAEAFSKVENPAQRTALAMEIFGKGGRKLLPLFKDGAKGLDELTAAAKAAGVVMRNEDAVAAEAFGDSISALQSAVKFAYSAIGGALAPTLKDLAVQLTSNAASAGKWLRENKGLVQSVFQLGIALTAAGAALFVLGKGIALTGALVGAVKSVLSPLGLLAAGIAGLGALWVRGTAEGQQFWSDLKETATTAWGGIVDAVKSGDLVLAGRIAIQGLIVAWKQLKSALGGTWDSLTTGLASVLNDMQAMMSTAWVSISESVQSIWVETMAGVKGLYTATVDWLAVLIAKASGNEQLQETLREDIRIANKKGDRDIKAKREAIAAEGKRGREQVEKDRLAAEQALNEDLDREKKKRADDPDLKAAKEELTRLTQEAADKAARARQQAVAGRDEAKKKFDALGPGGVESKGTFNPFQLRALNSGQPKVVEEQKKTNDKLAVIIELLRNNEGPAFT